MSYSSSRRDPRTILRLVTWAGIAIPLMVVGCGGPNDQPELGTVTGTVTRGGEPLANAWIEFVPDEGRLSAGQTDADGEYSLDYTYDTPGAKVGTHTVKIGTGGESADSHSMAAANDPARIRKQLFEKSGVTVESDENVLDFDISQGNEYKGPAGPGNRAAHGARR